MSQKTNIIYDSHAYCIPNLNGNGGFEDISEFRKHLQLAGGIMGHSLPAWRKSDRKTNDNYKMVHPQANWSFDSLKNVELNLKDHGRFEWKEKGKDYIKQILPPTISGMEYSDENLIAEMDYAGVNNVLLHRTPYLGIGNEFVSSCVKQFPDRISALAHIPEWLISTNQDKCISKLHKAITEMNLSGLQFLPLFMNLYDKAEDWDSEKYTPFWNFVSDLKIPIFFTLGPRSKNTISNYFEELKVLARWTQKYPEVTTVLTHGFNWRMFRDGNNINLPKKIFEILPIQNPNFYIQLVLSVTLGAKWEYPMNQFRSCLDNIINQTGINNLLWGSDHPFETLHYTYRQCINQIRNYRDILGEDGVANILGLNMQTLMNSTID